MSGDSHTSRPSRAFCNFPDEVVRDPRVTAALLVILAHRATFVGAFVTRERLVCKLVRAGLGKNVARRAIALGKSLGYIERWQQPGQHPGTFGSVSELLRLPATGTGSRMVRRCWFDGSLSVAEFAALLFMRSGTGKSNLTHLREVQQRFGWSTPTTRMIIASLIERGLLDKQVDRGVNGTFDGTRYSVPALSDHELARSHDTAPDAKSFPKDKVPSFGRPCDGEPGNGGAGNGRPSNGEPGDGEPGDGEPGDGEPGDLLTSLDPDVQKDNYTTRYASGGVDLVSKELEREAFASLKILGWAEEEPAFDRSAIREKITHVTQVRSDEDLRASLLEATARRINKELVSTAGLYAVRFLGAHLLHHQIANCPSLALNLVLQAIQARVGSQEGVWLNSFALIGKRIAEEIFRHGSEGSLYGVPLG